MSITVEKLKFQYSDKIILDLGLLCANANEFYAIVGRSGCGKTTLLKVLADIVNQKDDSKVQGSVKLFGMSPKEFRESGKLSFMFQNATLMPNLTVRQNIEFPLKLRKQKIDEAIVEELLEIVGLKEYENFLPKSLSGGMKTRVSLARAFVTKPEVLLLDEPFSALDIAWKLELYKYIDKIRRYFNTTIIIVTHDIQEAILLANKICVLSIEGKCLNEYLVDRDGDRAWSQEWVRKYMLLNQNLYYNLQSDILSNFQ